MCEKLRSYEHIVSSVLSNIAPNAVGPSLGGNPIVEANRSSVNELANQFDDYLAKNRSDVMRCLIWTGVHLTVTSTSDSREILEGFRKRLEAVFELYRLKYPDEPPSSSLARSLGVVGFRSSRTPLVEAIATYFVLH